MNQISVEFSSFPVDQAATIASIETNTGLENTPVPSICTTPSCTPLPLELHIKEDGCLAVASSRSTVVLTSSRDFQYSELHTVDDGGMSVSEVSRVKSFSASDTVKPPSQSAAVDGGCSLAPKSLRPVLKPLSPVTEQVIHNPVGTAQSPGQSDLKCSSPTPVSEMDSPVPVRPRAELKSTSPFAAPRRSSPVPIRVSPVPVPVVLSSVAIPNNASPVPKSMGPVPVPTISSPVPKTSTAVSGPNVSNSAFEPNDSRPETLSKNTGPVLQPRLSSPVAAPKSEPAVKSPALVTRKTYTFSGINSPSASPVQPAVVQANSPTSPPSREPGSDILDLTWPCQDPLLVHALDKLLSPDVRHLSENQPSVSVISGDEDGAWEEEDRFYPDFSREGTLTPMTESSWMDECFTPSTCPGTPDATLDLPTQQPSAVERLSASGQVGQSLWLSQNKPWAWCWWLSQLLGPFHYWSL